MVDLFVLEDCHCYKILNASEFLLCFWLIVFKILCAIFEFFVHFYQYSHSSIQSFSCF